MVLVNYIDVLSLGVNKKFYQKLNYFRFMGRFQKKAKKNISDTPRLSTSIEFTKTILAVLQL